MFTAWRHRLTRKRRYRMLDGDLEQFLLGFDAIRSAQAVPARWSESWDTRLKRGHEVNVTNEYALDILIPKVFFSVEGQG